MDAQRKKELLSTCADYLLQEQGASPAERKAQLASANTQDLWDLFRALVNTRPAKPATEAFYVAQDELLQGLIAEVGVATLADASPSNAYPRLFVWRGDITLLAVDVIVNAANSQMLGCWVPGHYCIDNAIHTYAGVQLRLECARLMDAQGHDEPTAQAKVTPAYNLPSKWVVHTVGPIAAGNPTQQDCCLLAQCYESCLDAANQLEAHSIAFCGISTGVFGFPAQQAAPIAVEAVRGWVEAHPQSEMSIVFDVFSAEDEQLYRGLLGIS